MEFNSSSKIGASNTSAIGKKDTSPLKSITYAKKGEPIYQKAMDYDDDGKITFEEFTKYCDEHGISDQERQRMLEIRMQWQMYKSIQQEEHKANEKEEKKQEIKLIYAKKGDLNYDDDMDLDSDNKVTYEEYIKYCEKKTNNREENNNTDLNKTDASYTTEETEEPEISIDAEA